MDRNVHYPNCCVGCKLLSYGMQRERVDEICAYWKSASDIVMCPPFDGDEAQPRLSTNEVILVNKAAKCLVKTNEGGSIHSLHYRYYQKTKISTGVPAIDVKLPDGGMVPGSVYVLLEDNLKMCGTDKLIENVLRSSQSQVQRDGMVHGLEDIYFWKAVVFNSFQGIPPYLKHQSYKQTTLYDISPVTPTGPVLQEKMDHYTDTVLKDAMIGLIIIDCIRPILCHDESDEEHNLFPSISQWILFLELIYGSLEGIIVLFILNPSTFPGKTSNDELMEIACDDADRSYTTIKLDLSRGEDDCIIQVVEKC